jgi:predicted ATPase/class 3 adenylate cyclase
MDIADWLHGLGLEQYAPAFAQNHIRPELLPSLTAEDLKDLGVTSVGHRRRLLEAIAALRAPPSAAVETTVREAPIRPEAERRQVTVMFCDLVGSTALSDRLDPEDLRAVIGRYQACIARVAERHDGFVAKYMGDGALIYFGYPRAHEDDAEQAVRSALALVDAVGELDAPDRLQVRVGIASGFVVVGDLIGQGSAQEQAIVGQTPNLAARLQALAEPNGIVIAESTRRQIGALFETAELGLQQPKGFAEPQRAWRVLAENRTLGRFEALRLPATPLVGRDEELAVLLRHWTQAKPGGGRVVLIAGEPGVGKSRLAEAQIERIAAEPHTRLRYFCAPHRQDSALYPVIAQLERAAGFARGDPPAVRLGKLRAVLAEDTPDEDLALIAELHGLASDRAAAPDSSPQRRKELTFNALVRRLERLSRRHPVLMVFEDIQWIDPSSRELLDRIIEQGADWPVLLLATFRPEFQPPWAGSPHVAMLNLARLDRHDAAAMVENLAGNALSSAAVEEIAERADGVPLFVEELTKAVLETGAQGVSALSAVPQPGLSVPATLHASLMARLDQLGPVAKDIAQKGALLGREFGYELLASVADLPDPRLREALESLGGSGLIFARGTPPQSTYLFKHALVQDAAYGTLLRSRRQQLHARTAAILEEQFPEVTAAQPELLAHHCEQAGLIRKAVGYLLTAGRQALARSAMKEAEALLRKGLDMLAGLPEEPWRGQQELDLLIALGSALTAIKGWAADEVGATVGRARALAERLDRREDLWPLLVHQWRFHFARSEHRLALSLAEQLEKIGEQRNDLAAQLIGRDFRGLACCCLGDFVAARELLERCHGLADPAVRAAASAGLALADLYPVMLAHLAITLASLGFIDQARSRLNEALAEARGLAHAFTLAHVLAWAAVISWVLRSPEMQAQTEELSALSTEHGFSQWSALATSTRGRVLVALGRVQEGLAVLKQGLAAHRDAGTVLATPGMLISLAQAHGTLGQPIEGLHCLDEAERIIEATEERLNEAEWHRMRGELLRQTGDHVAAEASLREAIALAGRQSAKLYELRAATSLARLWRDHGKQDEARALLTPIYGWFTEGFEAPDLQDARALLAELRVAAPSPQGRSEAIFQCD